MLIQKTLSDCEKEVPEGFSLEYTFSVFIIQDVIRSSTFQHLLVLCVRQPAREPGRVKMWA